MATEWSRIFGLSAPLLIDAVKVTKTFSAAGGTITALRDVSLRIKPGTLTVIVGPSGSGKTTLLQLFAGLFRPDSGSILFHGIDITNAEDDVLRVLREEFISIAYQEQSLIRYLSAEENVQLPLMLMDLGREERQRASDEALKRLGLEERKAHLIDEISGGERKLVNLARAMAKNPLLILADEPTANLDQGRIELLMELILAEISERGTSFIIATHDPILTQHADVVVMLRDGEARIVGESLEEVCLAPMSVISSEVFDLLEEDVRQALIGREIRPGQIVEALGTPFTITRTKLVGRVGSESPGIIQVNTRIGLDTEAEGRATETTGDAKEDGSGRGAPAVRDAVMGRRRPNIHFSVLKYSVMPVVIALFGLALAIWLQLGIWTTYSTSLAIVATVFLVLVMLYAPSERTSLRMPRGSTKLSGAFPGDMGFQWSASKDSLCDFCGAGWAAEICHMCGRRMCERCWPLISREPTFCRDHLSCHICGRENVGGQHYSAGCASCLICGNYVCQKCFHDGLCLECATDMMSRGSWQGKQPREKSQVLETLILEPLEDVSNEVCRRLGGKLGDLLRGREMATGLELEVLGLRMRVAQVLPMSGGVVAVKTQTNLLNRGSRDEELRRLREKSVFFVCYYPGCDYIIGRFCCVCLRPACPNHSTRCKTCGCPVCEDHIVEGECTRCIPRPIAEGTMATVREILGPLKVPVVAIISTYVMLSVIFYNEPLREINPGLPLIIFLLYMVVPLIYVGFNLLWKRVKKPGIPGTPE